jgi:5-methyltetrahydrofolate--homocysteine methyltransferase
MTTRELLDTIAAGRILVLDGAMGSLIQGLGLTEAEFRGGRFAGHPVALKGCNDLLCLTKPEAIAAIHEAYLEAGADIIETCSFNSTAVSLADYRLDDFAYEISRAAASVARGAADRFSTAAKPRFVAGSIGPTSKSASLSPDVNDPAKRGIYWDELEAAYYDNARGLLDGGADILLVETVYDTLNAKAALFAISRLLEERGIAHNVPVMVSATVAGNSGRILSGQTLEAFCVSVLHANPWAVGLNCSFGAEKLLPWVRALAAAVPCLVSAHPNAGLPNQLGAYDETPETMNAHVEEYLKEGLVNIIGGCCGSTPAHIAAIAVKAAKYSPRPAHGLTRGSVLAGLEPLTLGREGAAGLTLIGERTNVAGSRKFLRLISEEKYAEAAAFARGMVESGAALVGLGMDDAMLDAEKSMCAFLDMALSDPETAKVPVMIDSSRWNVIEAALKRIQGKSLVNSINLKDGEAEFLRRAALIRRYGAAVVVMLIDERGQAVSYERKIEIALRAYKLLCAAGFPASDIVFDPNVLAVATGISEHDSYAADFIRACSWIRDNCPGAQISGGISNLSFSFRGNNAIREAMHSVFLHHAAQAGLTMAIVNPAALVPYDDLDPVMRNTIEDVILNRRPNAAEKLLALAETLSAGRESQKQAAGAPPPSLSVSDRIIQAMLKGLDDHIAADVLELREQGSSPLAIVEGPLMEGMKEVGRRFGEGTMYLPQVIRSARVMKKAVAALEPYMQDQPGDAPDSTNAGSAAPKIILATVKGDVHDIGKNIVGVVLGCNGYKVVDLGVMVPAEQILETAKRENANIIGLSGLIAPSLDEMTHIAAEMEQCGMGIPLLIGGAAASLAHTALRIAPAYSGPVVYVPDAGKSAETVRALLSNAERPRFLENLAESYEAAAKRHEAVQSKIEIISLEAARQNKIPLVNHIPMEPKITGLIELNDYPLEKIIPYINQETILASWELNKAPAETSDPLRKSREKLLKDAQALLERIQSEKLLQLRGVAGVFPAVRSGDDIVLFDPAAPDTETARFCMLRSQAKNRLGRPNPCLADFLASSGEDSAAATTADWLGLFALSAVTLPEGQSFGMGASGRAPQDSGSEYDSFLLASLANALTEAFAEEVHRLFCRDWLGCSAAPGEALGIRPAFGYPASPDHQDKRVAFALLEAEKRCGFALTESAMIIPAASVCGMFIANPASYYFGIGTIGADQLEDWAKRKGISVEEARQRLGTISR